VLADRAAGDKSGDWEGDPEMLAERKSTSCWCKQQSIGQFGSGRGGIRESSGEGEEVRGAQLNQPESRRKKWKSQLTLTGKNQAKTE